MSNTELHWSLCATNLSETNKCNCKSLGDLESWPTQPSKPIKYSIPESDIIFPNRPNCDSDNFIIARSSGHDELLQTQYQTLSENYTALRKENIEVLRENLDLRVFCKELVNELEIFARESNGVGNGLANDLVKRAKEILK